MAKFSIMITGMYPMDKFADWGRRIEEYGFDEIHIADDLIFRPAWPILTVLAMNTKRIKLGPAIVTPQVAHPVYHAANLCALDELSGGRAILGIGRGGFNNLLGVTEEKPVLKLKEAYLLMKRMLAGDRTPFSGTYFTALEELYYQFDVPKRDIPMFIGTWGPMMAEMAGTIATGIKADCTWSPEYLKTLKERLHKGASKSGRNPDDMELIVGPLTSVSRDREAARDNVRGLLALLQPSLAPMTAAAGLSPDDIQTAFDRFNAGDHAGAKTLVSDESIRAFSATGTPRDIIPQIEAILEAGATHIVFGPPLGPDFDEALHLLATEVVPHVRRL